MILACDNAYALVSDLITELNVFTWVDVDISIARLDNFIRVSLEAFREFCLVLPLTFGSNVQSQKTEN